MSVLRICGFLLLLPVIALADPHRDVLIDDPQAVTLLQARGLDLGSVAFGQKARKTVDLANLPGWQSIVELLQKTVQKRQKQDPKLGVGLRFTHRLFDLKWLKSPWTRMELIGVSNRMDRNVFLTEGCGELRLIYRLAWQLPDDASRLPLTVAVVLRQPGTCFEAWKRWPWQGNRQPELLLQPGAALTAEFVNAENLLSLELNLQIVRWPSTAKPDLGGHAEYALFVLHRQADGRFLPAGMENQPDVAKLQANPLLRARLLAWLQEPEHVRAIDQGVALIPAEFLATQAVSVAPRGLARLQNRPFRQLFQPTEFKDLNLQPFAEMRTQNALLRRLDTLSCTGCHQANSLAGFHFLGADPKTQKLDALAVGRSAHLQRELALRQADMDRWPEEPPQRRREQPDLLGLGMPEGPCDLAENGFGHCADLPTAKLRCVQIDDDELGLCMPENGEIGLACEGGKLISGRKPENDMMSAVTSLTCPAFSLCNSSFAGFPAGTCLAPCGNNADGTTCAGIPRLVPFNKCLASGRPFSKCATENAFPGLVRACSAETPCRSDFVCSRGAEGQGACMPPYFLRQLRVDGHPRLK